jgi:enterochelin esterase-like enzyme
MSNDEVGGFLKRWDIIGIFLLLGLSSVQASEHVRVEFQSPLAGQELFFVNALSGWEVGRHRMDEPSPGLYTLEFPKPLTPKLAYKFVVNGHWVEDPQNPLREPDGFGGWNSLIRNESFREDPYLNPSWGAPPFKEEILKVVDWRGRKREVVLLKPPLVSQKPCQIAYFLEGGDYLRRANAKALLENLYRFRGLCFWGAFISPIERSKEYGFSLAFSAFLSGVVVPSVEVRRRNGFNRDQRLLVGASLGGLAALYAAAQKPNIFQRVISQSGSFWYKKERIFREIEGVDLSSLQLWMGWGFFEGRPLVEANQRLRSLGPERFKRVVAKEVGANHSWLPWRNTLREALESLTP